VVGTSLGESTFSSPSLQLPIWRAVPPPPHSSDSLFFRLEVLPISLFSELPSLYAALVLRPSPRLTGPFLEKRTLLFFRRIIILRAPYARSRAQPSSIEQACSLPCSFFFYAEEDLPFPGLVGLLTRSPFLLKLEGAARVVFHRSLPESSSSPAQSFFFSPCTDFSFCALFLNCAATTP